MDETCDSCGKAEHKSKGGLFQYVCRLCRGSSNLCDICFSIVTKEKKCIDCLTDGK